MTDAREVLAEIQQRVEQAQAWETSANLRPSLHAADAQPLIAALTAVLDLHIPSESHPKMCRACGYEDVPACPTVRAITDALGAGR